MAIRALALNCTLKKSPAPSSCGLMLQHLATALDKHGVSTETVRVADYDIHPGVMNDMGHGDQWPEIREKVLAADILLLGTPIWMGSPSSICKRVAERLDAILSEADDRRRFPTFGKVALVGVVGNEDGAHHVSAECYQWLNDVGYTIPANAVAYWVGEAMHGTDFKDLSEVPSVVQSTIDMAVSNAVHLANLLAEKRYPGVEG